MKTLRPYQQAAEVSLFKYLFEKTGHPLVVAPVAAGKSLMIAEFIKKLHGYFPRCRVVMLTHVKELLQQNAEELLEQYKGVDMGFYCAGLNEKKLHNDVTFASIQSINKKLGNINRVPEIIIIDECHLISHKDTTQYRKFIGEVLELNPNCRVIGYTGTPFRADTGRLDEGENKLFDDVAYEISMEFMIEEGYWAKPVCPDIATKMDVSGVRMSMGDYNEKQLQQAVNKDEVTDPCIKELIEKGSSRKKWLIFTAGIEHAEEVTQKLKDAGVKAECIHSEKPANENDQILKDHKAGNFQALVNIAKLTTGYNDPSITLIAFMRPTRSPVLYIQMIGRGVRVNYKAGMPLDTKEQRLEAIAQSDKPDCMVLDFGNVVGTLGPIDQVSIQKEYKEKDESEGGKAIMKVCPSCGAECAAAQQYCYACSYCFIKIDQTASNKAVMSMDHPPEWVRVLTMQQNFHQTPDSWQPSMKVTYGTMTGAIREWICFEHHKADENDKRRYAWEMAKKWHNARLPNIEVPTSAWEATGIPYPQPSEILIRKKGKYWQVEDYKWPEPKTEQQLIDEEYEIPF